jgi:hypothetical protein
MLSQRPAKAFPQIGQNVDPVRSKKILDDSPALFERQLADLTTCAPTPNNKPVLAKMDKKWRGYQSLLAARAPNARDASAVMVLSEALLASRSRDGAT